MRHTFTICSNLSLALLLLTLSAAGIALGGELSKEEVIEGVRAHLDSIKGVELRYARRLIDNDTGIMTPARRKSAEGAKSN